MNQIHSKSNDHRRAFNSGWSQCYLTPEIFPTEAAQVKHALCVPNSFAWHMITFTLTLVFLPEPTTSPPQFEMILKRHQP